MQTDPIVQCPNYFCQALNSESQQFCHACQTRIPKRYLWAVGSAHQPGERIDDRFLILSPQIALDTKPGLPPNAIEVPPLLEPYLHLMGERPAIPQPFAVAEGIVLLESAPIYPGDARSEQGEDLAGRLMPSLAQGWKASSGFRQLHFLWQLAQLWRVLAIEKVEATLLNPNLLFADGDTVRVLELDCDRAAMPTLADLGKFWATWRSRDDIGEFFDQLCQNLIQMQITHIDQVVEMLDQAIASQAQQQTHQIQIATRTDQGPSRDGNEDACYPPNGTSSHNDSLIIVCDGIGGHEGGEVASNLAIQTIVGHLKSLKSANLQPELEEAIFLANDAIAQKNDAERRQERQRMGTTVVMGLVDSHELYLTHIGDSRAYRITRQGCYQVTLDDDVASRETRLGYSLYRDALQRSSAGSLVQALGMGNSSYLRPNIQRFLLDEDCVFLLCSDGLSDNDRVEECWQTEIAPLLDGKTDVATVARNLVEIANTQNGHDNVTVGVIHCQTRGTGRSNAVPIVSPTAMIAPARSNLQSHLRTELQPRRSPVLKIVLILLGLFGVAGAIAALFVPELIPTLANRQPAPVATEPNLVPPVPTAPELISSGTLIRLQSDLPLLKKADPAIDTVREVVGQIPSGTVLQVLRKQKSTIDQSDWVQLKVCTSTAKTPIAKQNVAKQGDTGWQKESAIVPFTKPDLKPDQLGACSVPPAAKLSEQNVSPSR
jgi:serine/threonine protein phosphatase PrpC